MLPIQGVDRRLRGEPSSEAAGEGVELKVTLLCSKYNLESEGPGRITSCFTRSNNMSIANKQIKKNRSV